MAETTHSFNTAQGQFDVIKYSNGQEHMYSVDGGKKDHVGHADVVKAHHDPELQKKLDAEREEQARKAGAEAIDASRSAPEQIQSVEIHIGEALWKSKAAGKAGNNDLKVVVKGASEKYPDGVNPSNGVLYVELVAEDGTRYTNVRADRLEYPEKPVNEGAASARETGKEMDEQADEVVKGLDKILPPTEPEPEEPTPDDENNVAEANTEEVAPKSLEERVHLLLEEFKQDNERRAKALERKIDNIMKPHLNPAAGENLAEESKPDEEEPEVNNNGYPVRDEVVEAIKNGDHRDMDGKIKDKDEMDTVDVEAMEASMVRMAKIQKEMSESPSPERMQELIKELGEEQAKQKELWEKAPDVTDENEAISTDEALANSEKRRKNIFRRAYDRVMAPIVRSHSKVVTNGVEAAPEAGGTKVAVVDEEGNPVGTSTNETTVTKETDHRRRNRRVIGALLIGGGLVAAYFIGKNSGTTHIIHEFSGGKGSGIGPNHIPHNGNGAGLGHAHEHLETWNNSHGQGHRIVQSLLPDRLEQSPVHGSSGIEHIIDKQTGREIVDHVTYKGDGAYSNETLRQLHNAGWDSETLRNAVGGNPNRWTSAVV